MYVSNEKIARQGRMWQRAYRFFVCAYVFRPMQRNLYQNLSVALLSRAQELPFIIFRPPRAHRGHRPARRYP